MNVILILYRSTYSFNFKHIVINLRFRIAEYTMFLAIFLVYPCVNLLNEDDSASQFDIYSRSNGILHAKYDFHDY